MKKLLLLLPLVFIASLATSRVPNGGSCIDSTQICDTCICNGPYHPVCGCNGVTYVNSCAAYSAGVTNWDTGSCSSSGCIDSSQICHTCACPQYVFYVCGCNGVTYINSCYAMSAGVLYWTTGACNAGPSCLADFTYAADSSGLEVYFADASSGTYDSLNWNFGDSTSVTTGVAPVEHLYQHSGLYNVCLTIFSRHSSCYNTYCQTLAVAGAGSCPDTAVIRLSAQCDTTYSPVCGCDGNTYNNVCEAFYYYGITSWWPGICIVPVFCEADFSYWPDSTGYTIYFQSIAAGANVPPRNADVSYWWSFGDGTSDTGQFAVHTYTDTAIHAYQVCLTVSDTADSCSSTFCDSVFTGKRVAGCYAGFSYSVDSSGVVTVYPDSVNGGPTTASGWIIGNDTTNQAPSFAVDSNSNYNICYVVINDSLHCSDTVCVNAQQIYNTFKGGASGIADIANSLLQLYLYPNPAQNTCEIKFTGPGSLRSSSTVADITLRNILSEIVCQIPQPVLNAGYNAYTLNLNGLSDGVYLVEIHFNNGATMLKKLVKM